LLEHVREVSPYFQAQLQTLRDIPIVRDVRGLGLMACVECEEATGTNGLSVGERIDRYCQLQGLIVRPIYNMCVMSPPLIITRDQVDDMIRMLRHGIEQAAADEIE